MNKTSILDYLKDDIGIGEGFKNIDKLSDKKILINYSQIPWKQGLLLAFYI